MAPSRSQNAGTKPGSSETVVSQCGDDFEFKDTVFSTDEVIHKQLSLLVKNLVYIRKFDSCIKKVLESC